jgi:hypothetical protein
MSALSGIDIALWDLKGARLLLRIVTHVTHVLIINTEQLGDWDSLYTNF